MPRKPRVRIVWFKRDLRTTDHRPLVEAAQGGTVLPLFLAEPSILHAPDYDPIHWTFQRESLEILRNDLRALGTSLRIESGEAVPIFQKLAGEFEIEAIHAHEETGNALTYARDRAVRAWAKASRIAMRESPTGGTVRRLKDRDLWHETWAARMIEPVLAAPMLKGLDETPSEIPTHADLGLGPDRRSIVQRGGARRAGVVLDDWLHRRGRNYPREMSSPLTAFGSCSRLSPHLAWGTMSLREAVAAGRLRAIEAHESGEAEWLRALAAFESRLQWRDHFTQKLEDEPAIEFHPFIRSFEDLRADGNAPELFEAWKGGSTGFPMVDASMRALRATGYLNFRMRSMITAFAGYALWLDWRGFHDHLATSWTDYDCGIHISQLQMQSGTTGINALRIYNPVKQSLDHDPQGRFVRRWIPELAGVPDAYIHEPHLMTELQARGYGAQGYPKPIVDFGASIADARRKIAEFRLRPGVWEEANDVQRRHGSRRGQSPPARPRPPRPDPQPALQLEPAESG